MNKALTRVFGKSSPGGAGEESHWLSVADLMAGLMMVFLFIAVALMRDALIERDRVKDVAVAYQDTLVAIYDALSDEFADDLVQWDAEIDEETLSFNFKSPDVLFESGDSAIQPRFEVILQDFFPRYVEVLIQFRDSIEEVRIEGHTSSVWMGAANETDAYFRNMDLSQRRTRSVLQYAYELPAADSHRSWLKRYFSAVGFSSSRPILNESGIEDTERSRRVSFRVITNADVQIRRILEVDS
jgi:outer membrane protein OmpA-like peptidoglycan-associated protein